MQTQELLDRMEALKAEIAQSKAEIARLKTEFSKREFSDISNEFLMVIVQSYYGKSHYSCEAPSISNRLMHWWGVDSYEDLNDREKRIMDAVAAMTIPQKFAVVDLAARYHAENWAALGFTNYDDILNHLRGL